MLCFVAKVTGVAATYKLLLFPEFCRVQLAQCTLNSTESPDRGGR